MNTGSPKSFVSDRILTKFKKKANRIALITSGLLKEMSNEKLNDIHDRLFKPIELYKENLPDWARPNPAKIATLNEERELLKSAH